MKTTNILFGLVRLALLSIVIVMITGWNFLAIFGSLTLLSCTVPMPEGVANSVVTEVWAKYIIERFWKDNSFLKFAFDDSDKVLAGRIVHIPQPGSQPLIQKNRTQYPATAVRRSDTDVLYALDEYTTDPTHIPNIETVNISYDKQDSVLGDHMMTLNENIAEDMLIKWSPAAAQTILTTGTAVSPIDGQTGDRKGFDQKDLKKLMTKFNATKVPKQDRYVMIDDNMYDYFYDSLGTTNAKDFSRYIDASNGIVGRLHGFNIMTRSSVLAYDANAAVKAFGATLAATDNLASLAWQKNQVASAIGTTKLFQRKDDPLYYGDVYSTLVMAGGRKRRADAGGVWGILQDAA